MIDVKIFNVTVLMTNCCLLTDRKTGKMAVTDPGAPNEELNSEIEKNGGKLEYVSLVNKHALALRLGAFEDTGLEPEEVLKLVAEHNRLITYIEQFRAEKSR